MLSYSRNEFSDPKTLAVPRGSRLDITRHRWQANVVSKLDQLRDLLRSYGSCLVAYSGGVDSVFLARVARDVLGDKSLAVIADSASLPRRELKIGRAHV